MRHPDIPDVESTRTVFDGYYRIREDRLRLCKEDLYNYYTVEGPPEAAIIIPECEDGRLLLVREYRHPTGAYLLSLPGGVLDPGETPEGAARRELMEETGCAAQEFQPIGSSYPLPGMYAQKIHYLLARGVKKVQEPQLETAEWLHTEKLTVEKAVSASLNGGCVDGILCTGLFFFLGSRS